MSVEFATFGLILDDIEAPDGRFYPGVLGGGGPQTALGMRLWTGAGQVGLVAGVGADLPREVRRWLDDSGIDALGVRVTGQPTLRARQAVKADGTRTHSWQVPATAVPEQLARSLAHLPAAYRGARGWHLGLHLEEPDLEFLAALRALGGQLSLEPFRPAATPLAPDALRALLALADVFTPNATEAASVVGPAEPPELARRLLAAGARLVALRLGPAGSLVAAAGGTRAVMVPAVPVTVVDVVGAGNAFGGGLLTGWVETRDLVEAAVRGTVAASFALEQVGLPVVTPALQQLARERAAALRPLARSVALR